LSTGEQMERVGRFFLERKLAEGGMAEVYLAWQQGPGDFRRRCVVKRLLSHYQSSLKAAEMFLDEARITAQLNHPNIVQLYDFGVEGRNYYIALEYVDGCSVRSLLRHFAEKKTRPPLAISLQIAIHVAQALSFAHRALGPDERPMSLIHRDISPATSSSPPPGASS
jgi:serine/threonine-protein kinase